VSARVLVLASLVAAVAVGCGDRPSYWDDPSTATASSSYGLARRVVLLDDGAHRAVAVTPQANQGLSTSAYPVGHHVTSAGASPDGARLFVLAAGDTPRRSAADELPSLTLLDDGGGDVAVTRYPMAEPLASLAIDPMGQWAVAYAGEGTTTSFVQNPNAIVLFDLTQPPGDTNPRARTIRSFGGRPQRLTFTPTLLLPGGPRRLLLIETEQDVTLLDLDHLDRPEITVRLTSGSSAVQVAPAGLVVDDGDPKDATDARIALRTKNDTNVITMQLGPSTDGAPNDFTPTINETDVGGVATDIAFVRTDGGLRVAALVPSTSSAVLVEPTSSVTTTVALPSPYDHLSIVTNVVASAGTDVAMLWSSARSGVAFWTLGVTVGQPYRSVEVVGVEQSIAAVDDVPTPNARLKVLELQQGSGFYVLDLLTRTASPLGTMSAASLAIAPDGLRMWAFARGSTDLAAIDLATLQPVPLVTDAPIAGTYDVARADGGRSLIAIHAVGSIGATVFDALQPDTATSRRYSALLLGGP
jgi:hypothetical protein